MHRTLSDEDCDALGSWAEELEAAGDTKRAELLRTARATGLQSRELQRQQCMPSKRFLTSCNSPLNRGTPVLEHVTQDCSPRLSTAAASTWAQHSQPSVNHYDSQTSKGTFSQCSPGFSSKEPSEWRGPPGQRLPPVLDFCVEPPVLHVQRDIMFETRLGRCLRSHGLETPLLIAFGAVLCVTSIWEPLATNLPDHVGVDPYVTAGGRRVTMRITRPGLFTWVLQDFAMIALFFSVMHHVNRDLFFKALRTYDAVVILGSYAMSTLAVFYNKFDYWAAEGYYDTTWFVLDITGTAVVGLPAAIIFSTMDSWRVTAWVQGERLCFVKILISALVTAFYLKQYFDTHLQTGTTQWRERSACLGSLCSTPKEVFARAELTKVIFLFKLMAKYAMGWPFAFIRPTYSRHDTFKGRALVTTILSSGSMLSNSLSEMARSSFKSSSRATSPQLPFGSILPQSAADTDDSERPSESNDNSRLDLEDSRRNLEPNEYGDDFSEGSGATWS